jgi:hypothetical protein
MPTATAPLARSILVRDQQQILGLLEEAAEELARATPHGRVNGEAVGLLAQMVLLCLRAPEMMHDLWQWVKGEEAAGRLPDRTEATAVLGEQFENWLARLDVVRQAAGAAQAAGHPITGAGELERAAAELRTILLEIEEAWPAQEQRPTPALPYDQLRRLAERHPPPPEWYEEEDNLF